MALNANREKHMNVLINSEKGRLIEITFILEIVVVHNSLLDTKKHIFVKGAQFARFHRGKKDLS
ncbi:hypothetical protein DXX94_17820 [Thalassotalea euphylliae]|uniref:Uncharacterized protein n=1 Tax=Thalassotalea euphylliae TaxID=1655234 RepID=A0A3E0U613_9GAMM|nr:hypothetical protein DXX94_17820 [Thalassotalea euphylliae]